MSHVERVFERFHHEFTEPRHATVRIAQAFRDEPEWHDAGGGNGLRSGFAMQVDLEGNLLVLGERCHVAPLEEPLVKPQDLPPWPRVVQLGVRGAELGHDVAYEWLSHMLNPGFAFPLAV